MKHTHIYIYIIHENKTTRKMKYNIVENTRHTTTIYIYMLTGPPKTVFFTFSLLALCQWTSHTADAWATQGKKDPAFPNIYSTGFLVCAVMDLITPVESLAPSCQFAARFLWEGLEGVGPEECPGRAVLGFAIVFAQAAPGLVVLLGAPSTKTCLVTRLRLHMRRDVALRKDTGTISFNH